MHNTRPSLAVAALRNTVRGVLAALICCWALQAQLSHGQDAPDAMRLADDRLELTLFAEHPDIVTPIGMAIDAADRIFVVESHTHSPPRDYDGPDSDRIKVFTDQDSDGTPDSCTVFASGIHQAMNLAFSPDGDLYVVCAREVLRLPDDDDDGQADRVEQVLRLETSERYAHNSLLSICFDRDGSLYIGRGNTGSRYYKMVGTDGSFAEGYGDGGSVFQAQADGSQVREYATGFWNPFDLKFAMNGALLLVDNDPDARGPNRLLKVVDGGDYGYRALYGGSGNHPLQGWDGSLPGVLPFIAGTGEAPSGILDLNRTSFPLDYGSSAISTIWNENSIERFEFLRDANGLRASKSVFLQGGKSFRPVALDCDSHGNLFITDWVNVDYPNHGHGRIWRISVKPSVTQRLEPRGIFERDPLDPATASDQSAAGEDADDLLDRLRSSDPFVVHSAIEQLKSPQHRPLSLELLEHSVAAVRVSAVQALALPAIPRALRKAILQDDVETVRIAMLRKMAASFDSTYRSELNSCLVGDVSPVLFRTWKAAKESLDPDFVAQVHARLADRSNTIPRQLAPEELLSIARAQTLTSSVRRLAIEALPAAQEFSQPLWEIAQADAPQVSLSALAKLQEHATNVPSEGDQSDANRVSTALVSAALSAEWPVALRVQALELLPYEAISDATFGEEFLAADNPSLALAAADRVREWSAHRNVDELADMGLNQVGRDARYYESLLYAKHGNQAPQQSRLPARPSDVEQWRAIARTGGDPLRGGRIFRSQRVGCSKCHTVDGVGALLGPDLSNVAQSKTRTQIIDAILEPSREFPPQYQAWSVVTADGQIVNGLQLDHKSGGAIVMLTLDGKNTRFEADEIEDYRASPKSLMPDGLIDTLSVGEFRDLVAFLCEQN